MQYRTSVQPTILKVYPQSQMQLPFHQGFMPQIITKHAKVLLTSLYLLVSHILFASSCRVCFSVL